MISILPGPTAVATFAVLMLAQVGPVAAATKAGVSAAVRGVVERAAIETGVTAELHSGQDIFMGDGIKSQPKSGMQLMLLDESVFTIGPDSELTIDEFVYDPAVGAGQVTTRLTKGALRFVTGKVAKGNPQDMTVKLPAGIVGIRGTFGAVNLDGNRAYVVLLGPGANNNANSREGRLDVTAQGQTIDLMRPGFGTTIDPGQPPAPAFRFSPDQMNIVLGGARPGAGGSPGADGGDDTGGTNDGTSTSEGGTDTDSSQDTATADTGMTSDTTDSTSTDTASADGTSTDMGTAAGTDTSTATDAVAITTDMIASDTATSDLQTQVTTDQPLADLKGTVLQPKFSVTTVHQVTALTSGVLDFSETGQLFLGEPGTGFENGNVDITVKVDFGAQTIGGAGSTFTVTGNPPVNAAATASFQIPSLALNTGFNGFADYHFPSTVQSSGTADCVTACTAQLDVDLFNIGDLAPGGGFMFLKLFAPGSVFLGRGEGPLRNAPSALDNFDLTVLSDLTGLSSGVFHYLGESTFVQTKTDGVATNFVGSAKASLQIDFGARTVGGGLSGLSVDTVTAGGNILATTNVGALAFPTGSSETGLDLLMMPSSNANFTLVEAMIINEGAAVAARALMDSDYHDTTGGGQIARTAILTGLRAAGPAPAP